MITFTNILNGAAGLAIIAAAAPASAQYAPNGSYNNGGVVGAVINSVLGGGRYGAYGQGADRNAVDQCNKEVTNRFDFKGSDARVEIGEEVLTIFADDEFKLGQVNDVLTGKLSKRGVDVRRLEPGSVEKVFRFRQSFQSARPMSGRPWGPRRASV